MHNYHALAAVLDDIEEELKALKLWSGEQPSIEALASSQPFCIDTLAFNQWVQFVFLPKLHELISARQALPTQSSIAPMVEEYCKSISADGTALLQQFRQLDDLLTL